MIITVGNRKIKVAAVTAGEKPLRHGMMETLEIISEQPLTPSEIKAMTEQPIITDTNQEYTGYSGINSVSVLLFKPNDVTRLREEEEKGLEALRTLVADLPDELAIKHIAHIPGMRYDGKAIPKGARINWNGQLLRAKRELLDVAEMAPSVHPEFWLHVGG